MSRCPVPLRPSRSLLRVALGAALFLPAAGTPAAHAQDCPNTFGASDAEVQARFGYSIAVDGDIAVIGNLAGNGTAAGTVYVVNVATSTELLRVQEPTDPGPRPNSVFGWSVAIGGNRFAVGAPTFSGRGVVYLFDTTSGALVTALEAPDRFDGDDFGASVAIGDGLVVVGAPRQLADTAPFASSGQAYVFDAATGVRLRTLSPDRSAPDGAVFGNAVAIGGGHIVVGASSDQSTRTRRSGAVYVFPTHPGAKAVKPKKLVQTTFDEQFGSRLGYSVAVDGDHVVAGAILDDEKGSDSGAVYVFDAVAGVQLHKLTLDEGKQNDLFGLAVAAGEGLAFAFRPRLYVFDLRTGARRSQLPADPATRDISDDLGAALAVGGGRLLAGAPRSDTHAIDAGEVEIFVIDDLPDTPIVLEPEPEVTTVHLSFDIPGYGHFEFDRQIVGRVVVTAPLDCRPPKSFRVTELELRPAGEEPVFSPAEGVTVQLHEVGVRIEQPSDVVAVAEDGTFSIDGEVRLFGTVELSSPLGSTVVDLADNPPVPFRVSGSIGAVEEAGQITATLPETTGTLDLGLGEDNPTFSIAGVLSAHRVKPAYVAPIPSTTQKASVAFDFVRDDNDRTRFAGVFDRTQPPALGTGVTGTLRVGAYRAEIAIDAKGRSAKGAPVKLRLKVKKKKATFKIAVSRADLRAALAALPDADSLPRSIPWSLTLPDGWRIEGTLVMDGRDRLTAKGGGVLTRATLSMTPRK